jgi:type I restriction-modification system DNA methylase subunit
MNQHQLNKEIEQFIAKRDASTGEYSLDEIAYIQKYEGSGGLANKGARGVEILYEFYTPDYVCKLMHSLALAHGYDGGNILEPSIATGKIIRPFADKSKVTGFEINPVTARICKICYPQATIHTGYFETAFLYPSRYTTRMICPFTSLDGYPFSLVIGNPPYGKYSNQYSSFFRVPKMKQIELFFMLALCAAHVYYGLKLLRPGGLLIFLTSSNFLRNGITYNSEKEEIGDLATLIDAYRLPPVFAKSGVAVDILVFKKHL